MKALNVELQKFEEEKFWTSLEVHYQKINDKWTEVYVEKLKKKLLSMNLKQLKELCECVNLDFIDSKEDLVNKFIVDQKVSKILLYLREFQNKKKKSIDTVYEWIYSDSENRYDLTTLSKLYHLYLDKPTYLFDIFTLNKWNIKNSGEKYIYRNNLQKIHLNEVAKNSQYAEQIVNTMHSKSKSHIYKVVSTATKKEQKVIVLIYKQMSDVMLPDFDGNKRNKKIAEIMFEINLKDKSISIKSGNKTDERSLVEYFDTNLNTNLQKFKLNAFDSFTPNKFQYLLSTEDISKHTGYNLYISGITFNSSNLWKSPELSFELKHDDVWPAIVESHEKGIIRPKSLKDIKNIKLSFKDLSSKRIYMLTEDNGDITFRLQDANLSNEQIEEVNKLFIELFGVPINQPINNNNFTEGIADKVDYILKLCSPDNLSETNGKLFERFIQEKIIEKGNIEGYSCSNPHCSVIYEIQPEYECDECGNEEYEHINTSKFDLNFKNIKSHVKQKINSWVKHKNYSLLNNTNITVYGKKYELINVEAAFEPVQILITKELLPGRTLNRFRKLLTPTIIIYIGHHDSDFSHQNSDSILPTNFGKIYAYKDQELFDYLDNATELLESRSITMVTQASSSAYESLLNLKSNKNYLDTYTDREFEDDIFAILKDIFPNADKWGREMSGERVPEGLFSLQYTTQVGSNNQEFRRIYSFDCKLTSKENGYDLGIGEKRKAWDYIDELHKVKDITKYSDKNEVSGHIFITNKFKQNQINEMRSFFNEKMPETCGTIPVFIELDQILLLHKLYRTNYNEIFIRRNTFFEELNKLFFQEDGVITNDAINECFEEILEQEPEQRFISMKRVKKKMKNGGKVGNT
ncbi:hypothetical protein P8845_00455 [Bacillus spizizenii]|uniref:hypothetical protein n=1 Tax=Bacillus stercoris TaxID=2054641 RepID=UPI001D062E51|nr:hypothetical protein [Bacillus stercoris]MCB7154315.1 hypothetical protein [Bacillus stercoris]MCY8168241.1 hypothetical protein [Bacillus spizizenii]MCY9255597.1 hypothetical protein [Bacillus spizizenii]MEC0609068.1 hypothetical protein [Bacillus spizizenii]